MEDVYFFIAGLFVAGLFAGTLAGMLGVGGGIVIVPVLYYMLGHFNVAPNVVMHVAIGTSLASIIVTSVISARFHYGKGAVDMANIRHLTPYVVVGVFVGAGVADQLRGEILTLVFAVMALLVAFRLLYVRREEVSATSAEEKKLAGGGSGLLIGFVSALMGIGGGTFSVPVLTRIGFPIHRAIGTSAAIGFLIAVPGAVGFIISGWGQAGLPPYSLGYVNMPALLCIIPATIIASPWGGRLAHRMSPAFLRKSFGVILALMALRMLYQAL